MNKEEAKNTKEDLEDWDQPQSMKEQLEQDASPLLKRMEEMDAQTEHNPGCDVNDSECESCGS